MTFDFKIEHNHQILGEFFNTELIFLRVTATSKEAQSQLLEGYTKNLFDLDKFNTLFTFIADPYNEHDNDILLKMSNILSNIANNKDYHDCIIYVKHNDVSDYSKIITATEISNPVLMTRIDRKGEEKTLLYFVFNS